VLKRKQMRSKDLIELPDDANLIPGIYNYCDRWCERCAFSARCKVYLTERNEADDDPTSRDLSNSAFWEKLASIFQETREMLATWAEEAGVDLSPAALAAAADQEKTEAREANAHPLSQTAQAYARVVNEWFEQSSPELEAVSDTLDVSAEAAQDDRNDELDAAEVIRWYQLFIAAKIARGLISRAHEDEYQSNEDPRDSDGSIKIALIAIDRSLSAWKLMADTVSERANSIRWFIVELERLRLSTEQTFPNAREFTRPGFDEVGLDLVN
jgi:hypothetical protein